MVRGPTLGSSCKEWLARRSVFIFGQMAHVNHAQECPTKWHNRFHFQRQLRNFGEKKKRTRAQPERFEVFLGHFPSTHGPRAKDSRSGFAQIVQWAASFCWSCAVPSAQLELFCCAQRTPCTYARSYARQCSSYGSKPFKSPAVI